MPTYDYVCSKCGNAFEVFEGINAEPLRKCPKCAKKTAKRQLGSGSGLLFKGSGFYITDYRSEGYKASAKSDTGSAGAAAAAPAATTTKSDAGGSKSEKKPAKKAAK